MKTTQLLIAVLAVLVLICAVSNATFIESARRATPQVREDYLKSASDRYAKRISDRQNNYVEPTEKLMNKPGNIKAPHVADYIANRRAALVEQYLTGEDQELLNKQTPRQQYIRKWNKLPASQQQQLKGKRDEMMNLYSSSQDWIPMTTQDFMKFALNGPRPYWLWVTFTALDKTFHCPTCTTYHGYWQVLTPPLQSATIKAYNTGEEELPLIMAIIQPSQAQQIWRALNLNRAPVSILLPPEFALNAKIPIQDVLSSGVLRQTMMMNPALEDIVNPLSKNGFDVTIPKPELSPIKVLALIIGVVLACQAVYSLWPYLLKLQHFRGPFLVIAILFYLYAMSGGGFIKVNKPPMSSHKDGIEVWVSREYNQLLGAEMFVVGAFHFLTALGLFLGVASLIPYGFSQDVAKITTPVDYDYKNSQEHAESEAAVATSVDAKKDEIDEFGVDHTTTNNTTSNRKGGSKDAKKTETAVTSATNPAAAAEAKDYKITELDRSIRFERRVAYVITRFIPQDFLFTVGFLVWFVGYWALMSTFKIKMPSYPFGF